MTTAQDYPCDVCGSDDAEEIPEARHYTDGLPIHVCRQCGLVYCKSRRTAENVAATWSDELYGSPDGDDQGRGELDSGVMKRYSALTPFVKSRHVFVAEMIHQSIGLRSKRVVDIGAGQGEFLRLLAESYGESVFGIEPSTPNCARMSRLGIYNFVGIAEHYASECSTSNEIATIVWTLENCQSCAAVIKTAHELLNTGGYVVVATGSRILVPFKKPLQYFFNDKIAQDAHPFYFSVNTLTGLLANAGFLTTHTNRYIDSDYLVVFGQKTDRTNKIEWRGDDVKDVLSFFERWHRETQDHYLNV